MDKGVRATRYWPIRFWHWLVGHSARQALYRVLAVAALLGIAGVAFVASGLVSIAADRGHWPLTEEILRITMSHTVRMRTLGMQAPALDEPAMVLKGAGHYATGCMPCHGAPGRERPLVVRQMVPEPPDLGDAVVLREPEELFWIVKHGLKYTAMPAWPAQERDDEVWAMVAFLQRLPRMTPTEYTQLAYGATTAPGEEAGVGNALSGLISPPQSILANCARCHGRDGQGRGSGAFPRLAGQREAYLLASLQAYASGARHSGVMQSVAAGLQPRDMQALAGYYAGLAPARGRPAETTAEADAGMVARGSELANSGAGKRRIPACRHCHGPGAAARNPHYPELAGQYARYLALQLELFQQGARGGTAYAHLMHPVADSLSPDEIKAVSAYYATAARKPGRERDPGSSVGRAPASVPPAAEPPAAQD